MKKFWRKILANAIDDEHTWERDVFGDYETIYNEDGMRYRAPRELP